MALDLAGQVIRLKLKDDKDQVALVDTLVKEIKLN
jgi:hypothetical protein